MQVVSRYWETMQQLVIFDMNMPNIFYQTCYWLFYLYSLIKHKDYWENKETWIAAPSCLQSTCSSTSVELPAAFNLSILPAAGGPPVVYSSDTSNSLLWPCTLKLILCRLLSPSYSGHHCEHKCLTAGRQLTRPGRASPQAAWRRSDSSIGTRTWGWAVTSLHLLPSCPICIQLINFWHIPLLHWNTSSDHVFLFLPIFAIVEITVNVTPWFAYLHLPTIDAGQSHFQDAVVREEDRSHQDNGPLRLS